jgi:hypothetical protein
MMILGNVFLKHRLTLSDGKLDFGILPASPVAELPGLSLQVGLFLQGGLFTGINTGRYRFCDSGKSLSQ